MKTKSSSSSSPSSPSSLPSSPPSQANIVISGVSGRYPGSENLEELWKNLMNKEKLYVPDDFPYPNGKCKISLFNCTLIYLSKYFFLALV